MNILIITPYLPYPLNSGGAQGVFNMIEHLRSKHSFTMIINEGGQNNKQNLLALRKLWPDVDIIYYPFVRQMMCPSFLYEKTRRVMLRMIAPNSRRLKIETALRPYGEWFSRHHVDFVHRIIAEKKIDMVEVNFIESLAWGNYLPDNVKKVFIHHELGFVRKERLLSSLQLTSKEKEMLATAKSTEFANLEKYDAVVTVTDTDKKILEREGLSVPVYTSNSAVNTESFPYSVTPGNLTFIGGYGHLPNVEGIDWFVKNVAPLLSDRNLRLNIIGRGWPDTYNTQCGVDVCLKGFVEKLSDVALGSIMIVPILSGSGMRMKILEAAAMSLPMVTTTVGVEGLDFVDGESCIIADTPEDYAKAIIRLTEDADLRRKLGENANKVFEQKYSVSKLVENRDNIYQKIIADY